MAEPRAPRAATEPGRSVRGLLDVLTRRLAAATGGAVVASVWVRRRDVDQAVAATSQTARRADGPAVSDLPGGSLPAVGRVAPDGPVGAVLGGGPDVLLPDLDAAEGWSAWRATARGEGFRGAAVVGAEVARGGRLALALYLTTPGAADAETRRRAGRFARQAASLVALHSTIPERRPPARAPGSAHRPRVGVQTAVGALMEVRGCGEEEARRVLTVLASQQGRTLESVAASVLEHARRPAQRGA
ncbi:ANTAR domain-containing protein [Cellulomonas sp. C5510]|uniref:ANTAR domain-containing protein n=1 Tax=Cellulomonas sp. C5510 TaxID=2871170 RepID=UPI001C96139E|nr:ANTAR domain-containing protein [Cellulomonas sp. C5510]QZN84150.1 ANTAR domain-containing protein [Cellulomonas sp. C5510]